MTDIAALVRDELRLEAKAIMSVADQLDTNDLNRAFELLKNCRGKVVLTGIGKTGIIARKISATLASTGTGSFFLHAAEGIHGDLGMLDKSDVVIAVSNSGNNPELLSIIPYIKYINLPIIALTGNPDSQLAAASTVVLNCNVPKEYEPLGLVPTSSTTVALAVGDALAIALMKDKNFDMEDFARFHPGGSIGRKLLLKVCDLMHSGTEMPKVSIDTDMTEVILEISGKKLGCTVVLDEAGNMAGIITDGDLRRQLVSKGSSLLSFKAGECMTVSPRHCLEDDLAVNALNLMEERKITMLPILDCHNRPVGVLHMHDLIQAGII